MTDSTNLPRLYGEKEIGQILQRAAELQHDEPPTPSAGSMTLQELEAIATEAGIDPAYLRRIVAVIGRGTSEPGRSSLIGRTLTWRAERPASTPSFSSA